jgi:hypothetical protein
MDIPFSRRRNGVPPERGKDQLTQLLPTYGR